MRALIGYTGFVGSNLRRQTSFNALFNSSNFRMMRGRAFSEIVCAGLPAAKWIANKNPEADRANIARLTQVLATVKTSFLTLISTIDVYPSVADVNEDFDCHTRDNHAYGRHRLEFEDFVRSRFEQTLVVRLPALFGPGLKKNVIYDLLHDNCLEMINPDSSFQWYNISRLWDDIELIKRTDIALANLMTEPVKTQAILSRFFPDKSVGSNPSPTASYYIRTRYADLFGGHNEYIATAEDVLNALGAYVASERGAQA